LIEQGHRSFRGRFLRVKWPNQQFQSTAVVTVVVTCSCLTFSSCQ